MLVGSFENERESFRKKKEFVWCIQVC